MIDLISVHVPRTAGSTFNWILQQIYSEGLYRDYGDESLPRYFEPDHIPETFTVVHGHFPIEKYQEVYPSAKRITWLRHPINRIVSLYYYMRKTGQIERFAKKADIDFRDFVEIDVFHNQMTGHVGSGAIDNFDFVGVQEFFNEDMDHLSSLLGWPELAIPHTNITFSKGYPNTLHEIAANKSLIRMIEKHNRDDFHIYHLAMEKRAARTSSQISALYWLCGAGSENKVTGNRAAISAEKQLNAACGSRIGIQVSVKNIGEQVWPSDGSIRLGNHWLSESKDLLVQDDGRATPSSSIETGESFSTQLVIQVPREEGIYFVELDMVKEKHYWFKESGSETTLVRVTAVESKGASIFSRLLHR